MLNLHAPFRWAEPGDSASLAKLGITADLSAGQAVIAAENGRVFGFLSGLEEGESWAVRALWLAPGWEDQLAPRILAVADAIAADEGLAFVRLDKAVAQDGLSPLLDQEGFRPDGSSSLRRPVIPQG
jgi:hypothetical protein